MHSRAAIVCRQIPAVAPRIPCRAFHASMRQLMPREKPRHAHPEVGGALSPRWLSDLKARAQSELKGKPTEAKRVLGELDKRWLQLSAGAEGFLTGPRWTGLDSHQVVWGDMDSMVSHVNNVMYNRFAESSRVNWFRNFSKAADPEQKQYWVDLMTPRSIGLILRSIKTDYKLPIVFPDGVTVVHKLLAKPTYESTNVEMEVIIFSHQHRRAAARCFEDIVVYDYRVGKKASLEPFMVDELRTAYELQEATKQKAVNEILELQRSLA